MAKQTALPPNLAPRLLSKESAAAYVSVSMGLFDEMVDDGRMPPPRILSNKRRAWDIRQLDIAIDNLPLACEDSRSDQTWEDVDA